MSITDYSSLQTHVRDTLDRTDLAPFTPTLIQLAEGFLATEARLMVREAEDVATVEAVGGVYPLPADYGGMRSVYANTSPVQTLDMVSADTLYTDYPETTAGSPAIAAAIGANLVVRPTTTASVDMLYYRKLTPLSDANTTNWLLDAFPHVYMMASLVQTQAFIKDDPRIAMWAQMLEAALTRIRAMDLMQRFGNAKSRVAGPTP